MGFQLGEDHDSGMNEMNLIPLIDIMLVLMIIFLVTATVANPSVPLNLPETQAEIQPPPPKAMITSGLKLSISSAPFRAVARVGSGSTSVNTL